MAGEVVHFEVPADDLERAQSFYRDAFGWQLDPMPEMSYTIVTTTKVDDQGRPTEPGAINGGMMTRQRPFTGPVIVISVDDVDGALERVRELGGEMLQPRTAVGDMGFSAYFADPEGNVVGLWETARGAG
jgi:predicted enzyme related to lactoylglutathione lyase